MRAPARHRQGTDAFEAVLQRELTRQALLFLVMQSVFMIPVAVVLAFR